MRKLPLDQGWSLLLSVVLASLWLSPAHADDAAQWTKLMEQGHKAWRDADHAAAKKHYEEAAALVKDTPPEDGRYALSLGALAKNELMVWKEREASAYFEQAFKHQGKVKPKDPVAWAMVLFDYAEFDVISGGRTNHLPHNTGLSLVAEVKGYDTGDLAPYYRAMAMANRGRNFPKEAEIQARQAWEIAEKHLKPEDLEYAMCADQYGDTLLADSKNLQEATRLLRIAEKGLALHLSKEHYYVVRNRQLVGMALMQAQDFKQALEYFLSIQDAFIRLGGINGMRVTNLKAQMAMCHEHFKDFAKAEPEYKHGLDQFMKVKTFRDGYMDQPLALQVMFGRFRCLMALDRKAEVSELVKNVAPHILRNFGPPVKTRPGASALMQLLLEKEHYQDAVEFGNRMLAHMKRDEGDQLQHTIRRQGKDGKDEDFAIAYFYSALPMKTFEIRWAEQLSQAYDKTGNTAKAKEQADAVIKMREETAKAVGSDAAGDHIAAAAALISKEQWVEAMAELHLAMQAKARTSPLVYATASDEEKEKLVLRDARLAYLVMSVAALVRHHHPDNPDSGKVAMDTVLQYKAAEIQTQAREQQIAATSNDPQLKAMSESLFTKRRELATLLLAEDNPSLPKINTAKIAALQKSIDLLERQLSVKSAAFAQLQAQGQVTWKTLSEKLPPDTVFITYSRSAHVVRHSYGRFWIWLAVTVKRGEEPKLHLLPVDPQLDEEERQVRLSVGRNPGRVDNPNARLDSYDRHLSDGGHRISKMKLLPMWETLRTSKRWIISPDSHLANVPWALIPQPESNRLVIDDFEVSTMTSGQEIAQFGKLRPRNNEALIVAAPNFDAAVAQTPLRRPADRGNTLKNLTWTPLPGTEVEANAINDSLKKARIRTTVLTGDKATKNAVLDAKSPRFLHIATHGYFLPHARMFLLMDPFMQIKLMVDDEGTARQTPLEPLNALLYSGLALAGSNQVESGLLTAYEMANMNLWGTQVVVLSACDTGRGAETIGAGVTGLQRAIMQAGAQSLVMSLWPVPDQETAALMDLFYKHLLSGKRPALALRQAMLDLRDKLEKDGNDSPRSWGAFVVHGDPG